MEPPVRGGAQPPGQGGKNQPRTEVEGVVVRGQDQGDPGPTQSALGWRKGTPAGRTTDQRGEGNKVEKAEQE